MAMANSRNWWMALSALASIALVCAGGYALAGAAGNDSARQEFDAAWAEAGTSGLANMQLAQAEPSSTELPPSRPRGSTTMPAGASDGNQAVPVSTNGSRRPNMPDADATKRFRDRLAQNRANARPRGTAPLAAPGTAATQPGEMRTDSNALPEVSEQELNAARERARSSHASEAAAHDNAIPAAPPAPEQTGAAPADANAAQPTTPGRPNRLPPRLPPPGRPVTPRPAGDPGDAANQPGATPAAPVQPGATSRPGSSVPHPRGTAPQPAQNVQQGDNTPSTPPVVGEEYGVRTNEQTKQPEFVRPKEYFRLPLEERKFFFVWKNTPLQKTLDDVAEMAGLSVIGQIDQADQQLTISFESVQMQNFDEALTQYNELLQERGYWVIKMEHYLGVRRLTDWYRYIPPARMYESVEAFEKANLPKWELASVIYEPKSSPSALAAQLVDSVPDNTARATVVPDSNRIELRGFVAYIQKQLELAKILEARKSEDGEGGDGRELRAYPLKFAPPSLAVEMLAELMPPSSSGAGVVRTPAAPTPAAPGIRRGTSPAVPPAAPAAPVEVGTSTADDVEIREDKRKNQLLVRASAAKHKLVEKYMAEFIDVPIDRGERREVIKLQYVDPGELVEKITQLLGRREFYQPPAPPPRPGPNGQMIEQPAPPPTFRTVGSSAVLVPMENSKSLLVKSTEDEMIQIKEYIAMLDIEEPDNGKLQYVELKHGSASNIASVLSTVFGQRAMGRPSNRPATGEPFKAVPDSGTDKAIIIGGEIKDMDEAKRLITQMDVDPESGAVEHIVLLENATPSGMAETLSSRYGNQGGAGFGRRGYYGGGGSDNALPRFLPDDTARMLIVLCREEMWADIDRLIQQVDDQSKVATLTRTYRIKNGDAAMLTSILSDALASHGGRGGRRSFYGPSTDPNAPMFAYEPNSNAIVITAMEEVHNKAKELLEQLDQPSPSDQAKWRTIVLTKADAEYVESTLEDLFERGGRRRSSYGYGYGSDSSGGGGKVPVRIVAEQVSNRIFVSASDEDFAKIEETAKQIDADYEKKEMVRKTFELQYAEPSEVSEIIQTTFEARSTRSRGGFWGGGMSSEGPNLGVKVSEIGRGLIVQAPKDKMEEIAKLVAEVDTDSTAGNEIKTYKVKGSDYRGTYELANNLRQLFTKDSGPRGGGSSSIKFIGEYGSDLLMVSAPSNRMAEIDKRVNELIQAKEGQDLTMTIRHFDVKQAKPQEIADIIQPVLESKYQELQQQGGGGGRMFWGWGGGSSGPRVTAHKNDDRIMVSAPSALMPTVDELIKEFDRPSRPSTTRIITLMTAKAVDIAPVVEQQITNQKSSSGRGSSYGGWSFRWGMSHSSDGDASNELSVTAVESSNSIILTGMEQKVADAEALIKKLDEGARPEGMFKVIKVKDADLLEVADMVEEMVGGGSGSGSSSGFGFSSRRSSGGTGAVTVRTDYQTNQLVVFAPPEKFPIIEQIVSQMEQMAKEANQLMADTGVNGEVIAREKNQLTKLYKVKGPAKEVADVLDKALYELLGWDAPYVKPFTFTNEIIVEGEPKQFAQVEKLLQEIEKDPPQPKITLVARKVKDPEKVLQQVQRFANRQKLNVKPIARTGALSPIDMLRDREVNYWDPVQQPAAGAPQQTQQFVPPVGELAQMQSALKGLTIQATSTQPAANTKPAATTQPAKAATAPAAQQSAAQYLLESFKKEAATQPASTGGQAASGSKAGGTKPAANNAAPAPVAAKPAATQPANAQAAAKAEPAKATVAAPAPNKPANVQTVAEKPEEQVSPEDQTMNELNQAAGEAKEGNQLQVRYDPEQGLIFIVGQESQVKDFDFLLDTIVKELEDIEDVTKTEFRVFKVEHVAVEVASVILEQMFNDTVQAQQQAKKGQQPAQAKKPAAGAKTGADNKQGEEGEEGAGGQRRREEEEAKKQEEAQAQAAAAAAQRIKVIPDPRTGTLIIRAAPETFPAIAELLLKIDRPGSGAGVKIKIFQMKKLNASDVEEAIKAILKIDDGRNRTTRTRLGSSLRGMNRGGGAEADLIDRLQQEMLELEMQQQQDAAAAAANANQAGQNGKDAPGKLKLNPAKDIMITSDATTNTIIVSASDEGIGLVESLINQLEEQEIPLEIKSFHVENADAEKIATELEKVFAADRSGGGSRRGGMDGFSPGRVGGDIKIAADSRSSTIVVRALKPDMAKIEPLIKTLDVPPKEQQVQIYPVNAGNATEMAATLTKIFVEPGETGTRAVRIQPDAETNSLLVYAPTEAKQLMIASKIKELDEKVVQKSEAQRIELKFANASTVATTLKEIFASKSKQRGAQRIEITGDDNSGTLFVIAPEEIFKQIQKVALDLDKPANQEVRVVKLKYAVAADIEATFKGLLTQMLGQLKGKGGASDVPAVTPDPRTNSLVVVGSPAAFVVMEQALKLLDVPPDDQSAQTVALYPIKGGRAESIAISINSLYSIAKFPGGVQPPRAIASGKDMVYVYGTGKQIQDIKAQIIDPAEAIIGPQLSAVQKSEFVVQHAKADEVAKKIQDWFKARNDAQIAAGTTLPPSETVVQVMADPMTKRLFVQSSEANKKQIDELLKIFDTAEVSDAGLKFEVLPVKYTDVTYAYNAIYQIFQKSDRPVNERPVITYEYGSRSLVVKAMPEDLVKIKDLLTQIDREDAGQMVAPQTVVISNVKATEVVTQLNAIIRQTKKPDSRTGLYAVNVSGNDSNNTVVITAQQQKDIDWINGLITKLDSRPAGDQREVRPYVLKYADLGATMQALNANFASNANGPIKGQVSALPDYTTSSLLVTASADNHEIVTKIIEQLDKADILKELPSPEAVPVKNVRATQLAAQLNQMIPAMYRVDKRTGRYPVNVTGDDAANTLLVTARAEEMDRIKKLIADLDIRSENADDRLSKSYVVQYADLSAVYQTVIGRFPANPTKTIREQVAVGVDYANSTVIVTASPENQQTVEELIKGLDRLDNAGRKETKTISLAKARATDLAATLTATIRASAPQRRTPPPTVQPNDATNTLLVTATEKEFADIEELVKILDIEPSADSERTLKVYTLKFADLYSVIGAISSSFRGVGNKKISDTVDAVAEAGTYSAIVMANAENHEKVSKLIEELDKPGTGTRQTYTLEIQYADPEDVVTTLTSIYNNARERTRRDARVPAVFNVMTGTRKILVTTTPSEIDEIKELIAQVDVQESTKTRDMRVVPVQRIAPQEMAQMLTEYLRKPGRSSRYDAALLGDVRIIPSAGANAVVLTGPTDRLKELEELIAKVDESASSPDDKTGRQVAVIPLVNSDPSSVASVINSSFGKRGQVAEAELVEASAERTTNTVVVTAMPEKLEKVREMIKQLDENSSNTPKQQIVPLQHARAQDLVDVLTQTYRSSRRASGGPQIAFAADTNGNSIVVSAGDTDLAAIKDMISQLDKPATDQVQEMRVMPLEFIDATETATILSEHFKKPGGAAGRRGGASGELVGDIRIQASAIMNALIVSGSSQELDKVQEMIHGMDKDVAGASGAPRIIKLEHASPSQLAQTLTQMYTDPAKQSRGRTAPETIPLIVPEDSSNSLLVRARNVDYNLIEDMVKKLDTPPEEGGLKVIRVSRGVDVTVLSRQIQETVNNGELFKQQQQKTYRAGRVSIGFDERVPALIVAGTPALFKQVEMLVHELDSMKSMGSPRTLVVPVKGLSPADMKRALDRVIEQHNGVKQKQ